MATLCTLDDVVGYAPGYDQDATENADTNAKLTSLIEAETVSIVEQTGFEFAAITPTLNPRRFDVDEQLIRTRRLTLGAASAIASVSLYRNGSLVGAIAATDRISEPRIRQAWKPITHLRFPNTSSSPVLLVLEDVVEVDATWGFPSVPADVKEACAKRVVVRYLTDVAAAGTAFADAVGEEINVGGLLASARETVGRWSIP